MSDELLSLREAADRLSSTVTAVRQWAKDGRIDAVQLPSRRWRIPTTAVDKILAGTRPAATSDTAA